MSDVPDMSTPPGDDLAGRLASWLEGLGLADQLAPAGLPTYERDAEARSTGRTRRPASR